MKKSFFILSLIFISACTIVRPTLIQNLTHEVQKVDAEFDHRIKEEFSIGTPEDEIISPLTQQGFSVRDSEKGGVASIEIMQIACRIRYNIGWYTDELQRIERIQADVNHTCL